MRDAIKHARFQLSAGVTILYCWSDYFVLHYLLIIWWCVKDTICSSFGAVWRTPSAIIWCCVKDTICYHLVLCEGHYLLIIWCCVKREKGHPNVSALVRDGRDRREGQKPSRLLTSGYSKQNFTTIIYAFFHVWYFIFVLIYLYLCMYLSIYIYIYVCVYVCGWVCSMYGNANCLVSVWPLHARKKCSTQLNSSLQNRNYCC